MKKDKQLTPRQEMFLEALFSDEARGDIRTAMTLAGYSENTRPAEIIKNLGDEIRAHAKKFLAEQSGRAAWALRDSMDDPSAPGIQNKMKAAEAILNRAGVREAEDSGMKVPESGIVILPAKNFKIEQKHEDEVSEED